MMVFCAMWQVPIYCLVFPWVRVWLQPTGSCARVSWGSKLVGGACSSRAGVCAQIPGVGLLADILSHSFGILDRCSHLPTQKWPSNETKPAWDLPPIGQLKAHHICRALCGSASSLLTGPSRLRVRVTWSKHHQERVNSCWHLASPGSASSLWLSQPSHRWFIIISKNIFAYMCDLPTHICAPHACSTHRGQKTPSGPPGLELQVVLKYHVCNENWIQVLWNSSQCS